MRVLVSARSQDWLGSYWIRLLDTLLYQDDIFRLCVDPVSAQIGNEFMDNVMETKLLDFNLDKSCFIVIGSEEANSEMKEKFKETPLTLSGKPMKEVINEKYRGDYISTLGSADSALITVTKRHQEAMNYIYEIKALIEDCRAEVVGGIIAGLEIWEVAVAVF